MTIRIKKVGERLYTAELILPDMPAVETSWLASNPISRRELIDELLKRGCHQTDIGDAFYAADPDWLSR
jgi:hypothetical protein